MSRNALMSIVAAAIIAIVAGSFFIWRDFKSTQSESPPVPVAGGVRAPTSDAGAAAAKAASEILKKNILGREIKVSIAMPDDTRAKVVGELKSLSATLNGNSDYLDGWLQLGVLRKFIGDYEGAAMAWQYAAFLRPDSYVAFNNLGDLYRFYLKDYSKSEKYTRQALDLKPDFIQGYRNLADLYRYAYKEKAGLAVPILLEGIKKNPESADLLTYLASYYEDNGDKINAKKYFEEALKLNPPQKGAILQELNSL